MKTIPPGMGSFRKLKRQTNEKPGKAESHQPSQPTTILESSIVASLLKISWVC